MIFAMNGYQSRKAFPADKPCSYEGADVGNAAGAGVSGKRKCSAHAVPFVRGACAVGLIPDDSSEDLARVITRGEAVEMCRRMGV